jgi:hypothetical protein
MNQTLYDGERILPDDHVLQPFCWYLFNGKPYRYYREPYSTPETVGDQKRRLQSLGPREIRRCNESARDLPFIDEE